MRITSIAKLTVPVIANAIAFILVKSSNYFKVFDEIVPDFIIVWSIIYLFAIPAYDAIMVSRLKGVKCVAVHISAVLIQILINALIFCPVTLSKIMKLNIYSNDSYDFFSTFIIIPTAVFMIGMVIKLIKIALIHFKNV